MGISLSDARQLFDEVAVALVLLPFKSRPGVTQEDFKLLQPGMTHAEVERLFHGLPRNDLQHKAIVWAPQLAAYSIWLLM